MDSESILRLADLLGAHRGWSRATVSTYATGSGDALDRLVRGHDITTRRAARIVQWLADHWPAGAEWPVDIPRPDPTPGAPATEPDESTPAPAAEALAWFETALSRKVDLMLTPEDEDDVAREARWRELRAIDEQMLGAGLRLEPRGQIAVPELLCRVLGVRRYVYDDTVRRYADGRPGTRPRAGSDCERVLTALVAARDVRFRRRWGVAA